MQSQRKRNKLTTKNDEQIVQLYQIQSNKIFSSKIGCDTIIIVTHMQIICQQNISNVKWTRLNNVDWNNESE